MERLRTYAWPGNVREVENCARFLLCTRAGTLVDVEHLPLLTEWTPGAARLEAFERAWVEESLTEHEGNIAAAARASGASQPLAASRRTLAYGQPIPRYSWCAPRPGLSARG